MEAEALYDFTPEDSNDNQLPFVAGDLAIVTSFNEGLQGSQLWYRVELIVNDPAAYSSSSSNKSNSAYPLPNKNISNQFHSPHSQQYSLNSSTSSNLSNSFRVKGYVPKTYFNVADCSYFYGYCNRFEAEQILKHCKTGDFLVRQNIKTNEFCLSVQCHSGIQHFKILRDSLGKFLIYVNKFRSINKLVEHYKHNPLPINKNQRIRLIESKLVNSPNAEKIFSNPNEYRFTAKHAFVPNTENIEHAKTQITLNVDDLVFLLNSRSWMDDGWLLGQTLSSDATYFQVGLFPKSYVEKYQPNDHPPNNSNNTNQMTQF